MSDTISHIKDLKVAIKWLEEEEGYFRWIREVPYLLVGDVESHIEHAIEWCAERKNWAAVSDLYRVLKDKAEWSNKLCTDARVSLCDMEFNDRLEEMKNELEELTYGLTFLSTYDDSETDP